MFGYDINVNRLCHVWFERGLDSPNPCKEEVQCAHSIQATFTPILLTNRCSLLLSQVFLLPTRHTPDLASLHELFPSSGTLSYLLTNSLNSFKVLLWCHLLYRAHSYHLIKITTSTFPGPTHTINHSALTFLLFYYTNFQHAIEFAYLLCFLFIVGFSLLFLPPPLSVGSGLCDIIYWWIHVTHGRYAVNICQVNTFMVLSAGVCGK